MSKPRKNSKAESRILKKLAGGDRRSIGRADQVVLVWLGSCGAVWVAVEKIEGG